MKKFDILTIAGVVSGLGLVLWGILMESELSAFINLPGLMITLGVIRGHAINFEMGQVRQVMKITAQVLFDKEQNVISLGPLFAYACTEGPPGRGCWRWRTIWMKSRSLFTQRAAEW